jgi:hypothetical protein
MAKGAAAVGQEGVFVSERKAWTELEVGLPVKFEDKQSTAGTYKAMLFADAAE